MADTLAGHSDVATVYQTPVVAAALAGKPVRVIASLHRSNSNSAIVARSDKGIKELSDLKGKRIGVPFGTYQHNLLKRMLEDQGIMKDGAQLMDIPHAETPQALAEGRVDAILTRWPFVGDAENRLQGSGTVRFISPLYSEVSVLATTQSVTEHKREALHRLMRALVRAEAYIHSHPDIALGSAIRHWQRPANENDRRVWEHLQLQLRLDNVLQRTLEVEADWQHHAKAAGSADHLAPLIDTGFMRAANPSAILIREEAR